MNAPDPNLEGAPTGTQEFDRFLTYYTARPSFLRIAGRIPFGLRRSHPVTEQRTEGSQGISNLNVRFRIIAHRGGLTKIRRHRKRYTISMSRHIHKADPKNRFYTFITMCYRSCSNLTPSNRTVRENSQTR